MATDLLQFGLIGKMPVATTASFVPAGCCCARVILGRGEAVLVVSFLHKCDRPPSVVWMHLPYLKKLLKMQMAQSNSSSATTVEQIDLDREGQEIARSHQICILQVLAV